MTTKTDSTDRLQLNWRRLSYKTNNKTILDEVNGEIISGQFTGILGPSGSGKTTLIECLAGKRRTGLSGRVWVKNSNNEYVILKCPCISWMIIDQNFR